MRNKKKKKEEKTHVKEKQLHTQDNIYVIWQFAYVHEVVGISLLSGKKIQIAATVFHSLTQYDNNNQQNPNHQKRFLYPTHRIH